VDILAEEESTGSKIIIENQLEITNHDHLGKVITYGAGLDAETIIWIVKDVREEHQRAVDWLNEHTEEKINFFIIKMELWQIDNSPFAPKFQIISEPNNWAKAVKQSVAKSTLTEIKLLQQDFWNKFKEYAVEHKTFLKLRKAHPQHWFDISVGSSLAGISLTVNTDEDLIGCELYIRNSKELFRELYAKREQIESELGEKLNWMELADKKASRIKLSSKGSITDIVMWEERFSWLLKESQNFQKVFSKYLKNKV
ncbi:MAG: hypothetical protein RLZZ455_327, partial [Candidatus Parcubacteria bacterium]